MTGFVRDSIGLSVFLELVIAPQVVKLREMDSLQQELGGLGRLKACAALIKENNFFGLLLFQGFHKGHLPY